MRQPRRCPGKVEIGNPARHVDQVDRPIAGHLIGDIDPGRFDVVGRRSQGFAPERRPLAVLGGQRRRGGLRRHAALAQFFMEMPGFQLGLQPELPLQRIAAIVILLECQIDPALRLIGAHKGTVDVFPQRFHGQQARSSADA